MWRTDGWEGGALSAQAPPISLDCREFIYSIIAISSQGPTLTSNTLELIARQHVRA